MTTVRARVSSVMATGAFAMAAVSLTNEDNSFVQNWTTLISDAPKVGDEYLITIQKVPTLGAIVEQSSSGTESTEEHSRL